MKFLSKGKKREKKLMQSCASSKNILWYWKFEEKTQQQNNLITQWLRKIHISNSASNYIKQRKVVAALWDKNGKQKSIFPRGNG